MLVFPAINWKYCYFSTSSTISCNTLFEKIMYTYVYIYLYLSIYIAYMFSRLHSHGKGKTKFIELCLFQRHAHMFWVLRYFHLKFQTPTSMLALRMWKFFFFSFANCLWLYMSMYLLCSSRLHLLLWGEKSTSINMIMDDWITLLWKCANRQI